MEIEKIYTMEMGVRNVIERKFINIEKKGTTGIRKCLWKKNES